MSTLTEDLKEQRLEHNGELNNRLAEISSTTPDMAILSVASELLTLDEQTKVSQQKFEQALEHKDLDLRYKGFFC